jgi:RNA polymerase sigma factor (TIGR02999 family)
MAAAIIPAQLGNDMGDPHPDADGVTQLLQQWRDGRRDALDRLIPLVYDELHMIASRHNAREWRTQALQTTALVNEAFIKLAGQHNVDWRNRGHFFAIAATLMRRILVDNARREQRDKHGGSAVAVPLDDAAAAAPAVTLDAVDTIALDRALAKLEAIDRDQARIVELRFFGGLTIEEISEVTERSPATIKREWTLAKGWLYRELTA